MTAGTWPTVRLRDAGSWFGGGTPSKSRGDYWVDGTVPWLSPKDMSSSVLTATTDQITDQAVRDSSTRLVLGPSVAIVVRSGILERTLPVAVVPFNTTLNQDMKALRPGPNIDVKWAAWWLRSEERRVLATCRKRGTTVASIDTRPLLDLEMPVPPLREQRRIVEFLEDQLSRLDVGMAGCTRARQRDVALRRALLLRAATGSDDGVLLSGEQLRKIDWGGPEPPALPLPPRWLWTKWRDVGFSQNGRAFPSNHYVDDGVRLLRPGNLGPDGRLTWTPNATRRLPQRYVDSHRDLLVGPGDLVVNLTAQSLKDEFLGRTCIVGEGDDALLNQRLARLVPHAVSPEFALIVFRSPLFRAYVQSLNSGSLIQHMFTKQIAEFWMPVPPPDQDSEIVARSAQQLAVLARFESVLSQAESRAVSLRRSLLAAAFSGGLCG